MKHGWTDTGSLIYVELKSDLGGIETALLPRVQQSVYVLKSDLGGIETAIKRESDALVSGLKSDLGGIETRIFNVGVDNVRRVKIRPWRD